MKSNTFVFLYDTNNKDITITTKTVAIGGIIFHSMFDVYIVYKAVTVVLPLSSSSVVDPSECHHRRLFVSGCSQLKQNI